MRNIKLWIGLTALVLIASYFLFDVGQYLSLEYLQSKHQLLVEFAAEKRITAIAIYFFLYVVAAVLCLPGISILTLGAGAIFGFTTGFILVSFAATVGATSSFLMSRYLFRDILQKRFSSQLQTINAGVEKEGAFYLFTTRLIPLIPFFLINLLMGLTSIKTSVFYIVSQIGMLPVTGIFTWSGHQLSKIETMKDIFSPSLLFAFVLLGIFPIAAKKVIELYQQSK